MRLMISIFLIMTLSRIAIPPFFTHLPNFSAVDAVALFSGAYFSRRLLACGVVLFSVWVGDVFLNKMLMHHWVLFYPGCYWQYVSYLLITLLGVRLKTQVNIQRLVLTSLYAAIFFFIISNFGVWAGGMLYPFTVNGLVSCYVAALPFFKNTLCSDLFFTLILFGGAEFIHRFSITHSFSSASLSKSEPRA